MIRTKVLSIMTSVVLAGTMLLPVSVFGVPNTEGTDAAGNSTVNDYEDSTYDNSYEDNSYEENNSYSPYDATEEDTSDQYEYYDENGQLIEEPDIVPVEKDTSWFDYTKPRKSYNISTQEQLFGLMRLVNEEQTESWKPSRVENFKGVTFNLVKDIELTYYWTPIGIDDQVNFAGVFDGNGHTISGLEIDETSEFTGFFGYLTGQVRNLSIEGSIKSDGNDCGGLAGVLAPSGKLINCVTDVTISGQGRVGGVVGKNDRGTIQNCINCAEITGSYNVGGVVGENWGGTVFECGNRGKIISIEEGVSVNGTGGVAGRSVSAESNLSSCYNTGDIDSHNYMTGGVVGYANAKGAKIDSCYSIGSIAVTKADAVKSDSSAKKKSQSSKRSNQSKKIKEEEALTSPYCLGGIVGMVGVKGVVINNCYDAGTLNGADIIGGIIGKYMNESKVKEEPDITNNFFIESYVDYGIGKDFEENTLDIPDGTTPTTLNTLMTMGVALGTSYMDDLSNAYGSNGFPVLRWQSPLQAGERTHLDNVSGELQDSLDKAMVTYEEKARHGDAFIAMFDGKTYIDHSAGQAADFADGGHFEMEEH